MRLLRVEHASRRTIIYHPSLGDIVKRLRCVFGLHEYTTVRSYASVGAKEEMCLHCLKERYRLEKSTAPSVRASSAA